ncbi:hypothetical protein VP01_592g17 [Puccinia sorghi]|uniref:Uncharacterized protein n=1 Tax=Puccinia sorghi TaxID=27349 RepID=A0A0L6UHQ8_9BASI|nr:hypothetical protein VP01_592g17 [Puccinia sorghi]
MPPKRTSTSTPNIPQPCIPASSSKTPLSRQKSAPISWKKDGPNGTSSICIILEWLAIDGNYQRWRGDNKGGATKSTLAAGILAEMVDTGIITHQDTNGIQTNIQELQVSYTKVSDFLCGTGAGIPDEDVQDGSTALWMCRYWDVLHPIMGAQTCTNPLVTSESTCLSIPNLLSRNGNSPPADQQPNFSKAVGQTEEGGSSATPNQTGGSKRKATSKGDSCGLEQVLNDSYKYRLKCFEVRERREALKLAAENKQARIDSILKKRKLQLEDHRMRVIKMEAQVKVRRAKIYKVCARIGFIKELRDLGQSQEEIERFLSEQSSRVERPSNPPPPDNESSEGKDSFNNDDNPITL